MGQWEMGHRPQTQIKLSRSDQAPCVSGVGYDLMATHSFIYTSLIESRSLMLTFIKQTNTKKESIEAGVGIFVLS